MHPDFDSRTRPTYQSGRMRERTLGVLQVRLTSRPAFERMTTDV